MNENRKQKKEKKKKPHVAWGNVTEHGDLILDALFHWFRAPAHHKVGRQSEPTKISDTRLGGLGLLLASNNWHQ